MTNLSILDQNIIHAFRGVTSDARTIEEMEAIYLRWKGRDWRKAEECALQWERISSVFVPISVRALVNLKRQHRKSGLPPLRGVKETITDLREFARKRVQYMRFPGKKPE